MSGQKYFTHRGITLCYSPEIVEDAFEVYGLDLLKYAQMAINNYLGNRADATLGSKITMTLAKQVDLFRNEISLKITCQFTEI